MSGIGSSPPRGWTMPVATLDSQEGFVRRSTRISFSTILVIVVFSLVPSFVAAADSDGSTSRTYLHKNWQIQSSCDAKATGDQISQAGFDTAGWHKADIPATVVGALVTDKTYP